MEIKIPDKLYKDIRSYCELNDLETDKYITELLRKSFTIERFGEKPGISKTEKVAEIKKEAKKEEKQKPVKTKPIQIVEFREEDIVEDEKIETPKKNKRILTKKQ